jgi:hypothetical protein
MTLSEFVTSQRNAILSDLRAGKLPNIGEYSEQILREGRAKGLPQMGSVRYEPDALVAEFIFPATGSTSTVLAVRIPTPQRIVFMPVPPWVIESIWQGEIDGSFHFESDANRLVGAFTEQLSVANNFSLFGDKAPTRRG